MQVVKVNGHTVEFYSTSESLPIKRYQRFNKYLMIDNDVGSTFEDYDKRTARAIEFLKKDMKTEAVAELSNRRQMVYNAFEDYSPKNMALAIMVYSIDGNVKTDFSEDGLNEILEQLNDIGYNRVNLEEDLPEIKKKIEEELEMYFPKSFGNKSERITENGSILKRMNAELNFIISGEDDKSVEQLYDAEKEILGLQKVNVWNVYKEGNMEIEMEVEFEKYLIMVSEHTKEDMDKISTFRFYALQEYLKEKHTKK